MHKSGYVKASVEALARIIELDIHECILMLTTDVGFDLLINPLDGRLDYPATKSYTKDHVNQMRNAERLLNGFWRDLDGDLKSCSGGRLTLLMRRSPHLFAPGKLRTPPYKAPIAATDTKAKSALKPLDTNTIFPLAPSIATSGVVLPKPKHKVKTRGVPASPAPAEPVAVAEEPPPETVVEKVEVSKRAYKVLNALLPSADSSSHQRSEIAWEELLRALNEIGLQPEKLYGSVWVFKPREDGQNKVDVKRCISFHEPKEVRKGHKVPQNMVRTFGRRLKHAYGWEDGMFECE